MIPARTLFPLLLALTIGAPAWARTCAPIEVRNPDGNYIVPGVLGNIPYLGDLALDAYVQQGAGRPPTVVVIHGGGWTSGGRAAHVGQILELLTRAGYHWISVDYRSGGLARYQDALTDLRGALAFLRCRGPELGIDPARLVLLGEDSGAHLAALLAAERPDGVIGGILLGGFYDLEGVPALTGEHSSDLLRRASPVGRMGRGTPPLLVVHGSADTEAPVDRARQYCELAAAQGRCRFLEVAGASHRAENWWPSQWGYKDEIVRWISSLPAGLPVVHRPRNGGRLQKSIVYESSTGQALDAFVPSSAEPTAAVIVVHGGGWEAGDKVTYVTPLFEPLARAGLAWFSIDYRLTPAVTHVDQLEDVRQAIRFVRAQHARFNIDPDRIFLLGESASGQMVSHVGTEDRSLAGVISFYGVYDFPAMVTDASPRSLLVRLFARPVLDDASQALLRKYSPLYNAHRDMPPMLLVNGTGERLWEQAQAFAGRLRGLGVQHELITLPGAPHGLENWEGHTEWMTYKARVVDWIKRHAR